MEIDESNEKVVAPGKKSDPVDSAFREASQAVKVTLEKITLNNVHQLSTFELRQELVRRDAFTLKESDHVNYKILLRLMVELLQNDERQRQEQRAKQLAEQQEKERERLVSAHVCISLHVASSAQSLICWPADKKLFVKNASETHWSGAG